MILFVSANGNTWSKAKHKDNLKMNEQKISEVDKILVCYDGGKFEMDLFGWLPVNLICIYILRLVKMHTLPLCLYRALKLGRISM